MNIFLYFADHLNSVLYCLWAESTAKACKAMMKIIVLWMRRCGVWFIVMNISGKQVTCFFCFPWGRKVHRNVNNDLSSYLAWHPHITAIFIFTHIGIPYQASFICICNLLTIILPIYLFVYLPYIFISIKTFVLRNSAALVREWTIPTERPPLVGEVNANFSG
jgi:hypothetical protein